MSSICKITHILALLNLLRSRMHSFFTLIFFCKHVSSSLLSIKLNKDKWMLISAVNAKRYDNDCYAIFIYFQTMFILLLGPFVFFNVQKTKYLQLLTSVMRWLAFTIMIIYAIKNLFIHGPRGDPPIANLAGKLWIYMITNRLHWLTVSLDIH